MRVSSSRGSGCATATKPYGEAMSEAVPWERRACENCNAPIGEHLHSNAANCIADWRYRPDGHPLREKLRASILKSLDSGAALALYWWIHNSSEYVYAESWPWSWERQLRAAVDAGDPNHLLCDGEVAQANVLRKLAGGWWWVVDGDPMFIASDEIPEHAE